MANYFELHILLGGISSGLGPAWDDAREQVPEFLAGWLALQGGITGELDAPPVRRETDNLIVGPFEFDEGDLGVFSGLVQQAADLFGSDLGTAVFIRNSRHML
jgi:hypothetical protein